MVTFMSTNEPNSTNCIANIWTAPASNAGCPLPVAANGFSSNITYLLGPMPAAGASVSNLEAVTANVGSDVNTAKIDLMNNSTGLVLLTCTINDASITTKACQNTGSALVAAGQYLQVRVTFTGAGMDDGVYRVTFRY